MSSSPVMQVHRQLLDQSGWPWDPLEHLPQYDTMVWVGRRSRKNASAWYAILAIFQDA